MRFSQARAGRIFVLRLADGEIVHTVIEQFARDQGIAAATVIVVGGADRGSRLVVGPVEDRGLPLEVMEQVLAHAHEAAGVGTIFPDESGRPVLHLHMACGRQEATVTGCIRQGVKVWHVMEVVVAELLDSPARRVTEQPLGLKLLKP
jgi:predicted DNA-binding protein with PD1-like motif